MYDVHISASLLLISYIVLKFVIDRRLHLVFRIWCPFRALCLKRYAGLKKVHHRRWWRWCGKGLEFNSKRFPVLSYTVEIGVCPYFSSKILFSGAVRKATRGSFDQAWSSFAEKLLLAQIVRRTMWMGSTGLCRIRTRCQTCLLLLKHYENWRLIYVCLIL